MKLNKLILGLLLVVFLSCNKKDTPLVVIGVPPVEVKLDADVAKYGKTIVIDTKTLPISTFKKESISEGVDYMKFSINVLKTDNQEAANLVAHIVRLDRKALLKDISIESFMGGKYLSDRATPLNVLKTESNTQKSVLAAVNGDFFVTEAGGTILGAMIKDGAIVKTANSDWKMTYGITKNNNFFMDELNYTMTLDADNYPLTSVNGPRVAESLVLYTTSKGTNTGANPWGSEILLKPVDGDWETLKSYENVVCEIVSNAPAGVAGGIAIPKGHIVLSGHGAGIAVCNRYRKGDKVSVKISKPKGKTGEVYDVKEAIGISYPILMKGEVQTVVSTAGNPNGKEPRTAVGHSADYFYLVAVEGRSPISQGLTVKELGYLLKHFDATDAANLDGGGSTMLAVGNEWYGQAAGTTYFRPVPNVFSIVRKN